MEYPTTATGEKVVAASRRPDGTLRKERRIRAGYTPQDEVPTYVSAGSTFSKQGGLRCPGYDPSADTGDSGAAKSKAAKKNEKRKAKKADGGADEAGEGPSAAPCPAAAPAAAAAAAAATSSGGGEAAPAGAALSGPAATVDRQIKALSKKVRQCQALKTREAAGGEALTSQEKEKVEKLPGWEKEVKELQQMLARLTAA
ncbi:hypothetical protein Rsub_00831 [Raphidocelis subcapitata]|uniref:WIBG Mago-binding domain-containing protein n=1 Tax=Raphidocelis subcapitata TaxID=307507 RepID=A0A2V0NLW0_9CHLO|nr:hypothetical protein Rsub_00831 [Raphidocelis subcapitata]|eukprot:GBF88119.1 hypothetical protein Rsub_00831 [Raphidocelis subcapitata]